MKELLTDPMLRYVLVGGALFAAFGEFVGQKNPPIEISASYAEGLAMLEAERIGRTPTELERRALVARHVEEEALYREALGMGLDEGDLIVRRRLVQKMRFLLDDTVVGEAPSVEDLAAYLEANADALARPALVDFEHRFFTRDREPAHIDAALQALLTGASQQSDPFLLTGPRIRAMPASKITEMFGPALRDAVLTAPKGVWSGPVDSRYGRHLIRVTARTASIPARLDDPGVRAEVARRVSAERRAVAVRSAVKSIVDDYAVVIEAPRLARGSE